jgi:hypothetical protein
MKVRLGWLGDPILHMGAIAAMVAGATAWRSSQPRSNVREVDARVVALLIEQRSRFDARPPEASAFSPVADFRTPARR